MADKEAGFVPHRLTLFLLLEWVDVARSRLDDIRAGNVATVSSEQVPVVVQPIDNAP
ncbi:hypothetical protein [Vreelandella profundi]|uniref:hypothetical protein n=1 Tax=Vreelandella profundi TaxID=2852117 RepID=UPI001EF07F06|nr:hypothetical protein [Halomonas profundi]